MEKTNVKDFSPTSIHLPEIQKEWVLFCQENSVDWSTCAKGLRKLESSQNIKKPPMIDLPGIDLPAELVKQYVLLENSK